MFTSVQRRTQKTETGNYFAFDSLHATAMLPAGFSGIWYPYKSYTSSILNIVLCTPKKGPHLQTDEWFHSYKNRDFIGIDGFEYSINQNILSVSFDNLVFKQAATHHDRPTEFSEKNLWPSLRNSYYGTLPIEYGILKRETVNVLEKAIVLRGLEFFK